MIILFGSCSYGESGRLGAWENLQRQARRSDYSVALGLVLMVVFHSANLQDHDRACFMLSRMK
ncbi:hypothetical protein Pla111_28980 [Botrimarina hoheduenensis]|uniref:Uncharacterized protein n=1 Tax=Botrimarina hoheduenensis TaxID=2528000 RepID=A0A5C5VVG2_9BACT|nr:hypothetical protein Pla111_28980 [Botrimarina hoheduenensis]